MEFRYIIEVFGDIVATECVHHAIDWVCYGSSGIYDEIVDNAEYNDLKRTYTGNLFLDSKRKAVPYAIYVAHNDIQCTEKSDIAVHFDGGSSAFYYLKENMDEIKEKLTVAEQNTSNYALNSTLYNALLIECYSSLELFLSDFVLGKVFISEDRFIKARNYCLQGTLDNNTLSADLIIKKIRDYFTASFVFHRLDKTKKLFNALDLIYPNSGDDLKSYLHLRNNIVHRYSISNIDRMTITNASREDVYKIIIAIERFSQNILSLNSGS